MPGMDEIEYEILEDGQIKWTSGKVSTVNHMSAEEFMRFIARETGGETTRQRRGEAHHHHHQHEGEHEHE